MAMFERLGVCDGDIVGVWDCELDGDTQAMFCVVEFVVNRQSWLK